MQQRNSPAVYYAIFLLSGLSVMLFSVLVPALHLTIADDGIGRLVATQFVGQQIGALLIVRRADRSLLIGLLLSCLSAAALGLAATPTYFGLLAYGIGLGMVMTATNILAGLECNPEHRTSRLEMLNVFWPMGAVASPFLLKLAGAQPQRAFLVIAAITAIAIPCALLHRRGVQRNLPLDDTQNENERSASIPHLLRLCLLALLAVGVESALSNWAPTFAARYISLPATSVTVALFWIGAVTGRTAASHLLQRFNPLRYAILAAACASISAAAFALATRHLALFVFAFTASFCISPLYPTVLGRSLHLRGKNFVFFSAGIGSSAMPWIVGTVSLHAGSLRTGLLVAAAAALVLTLMLWNEERSAT